MQVISVDCGRQGVKAVSGNRRLFIPSIVGEWRERKISEGGEYEVSINGQQYFIGELAERESRFRREMATRSKLHEETKALTLAAIAILAEHDNIKLVTGLPVEQYTKELKAEFTKLLTGYHVIEVNNTTKHFTLQPDDISISIEGGGAYWTAMPGTNKCRVIDLGSRTINALTIYSNRFADLDSTTLDYGCLEIQNAAGSEQAAEQLARRIYADLSRRWLDLKNELVLLAGGGSLLMERWLKEYFPGAKLVADPVYGNALGWYSMGVAKWQGKS